MEILGFSSATLGTANQTSKLCSTISYLSANWNYYSENHLVKINKSYKIASDAIIAAIGLPQTKTPVNRNNNDLKI